KCRWLCWRRFSSNAQSLYGATGNSAGVIYKEPTLIIFFSEQVKYWGHYYPEKIHFDIFNFF
ncbi:MAG: hypothetical protein WBP01_04165, partial [Ferruginibacter sp.]